MASLQWTLRLLPLLLALVACGCSPRDSVLQVEDDDPEMAAAISQARASLPHLWSVFERPIRGESVFSLKVKITDGNGTEHFWVGSLERRDGVTTGKIDNDPNIVRNVKLGERITIPDADISDWLYKREGKMVGNYTLRAMFKQMPAEEVSRFRAMMADP
ncbi:MAG: YegJ family protein [Armatimonadota bacterium]